MRQGMRQGTRPGTREQARRGSHIACRQAMAVRAGPLLPDMMTGHGMAWQQQGQGMAWAARRQSWGLARGS